jgi:hypothetical protein
MSGQVCLGRVKMGGWDIGYDMSYEGRGYDVMMMMGGPSLLTFFCLVFLFPIFPRFPSSLYFHFVWGIWLVLMFPSAFVIIPR